MSANQRLCKRCGEIEKQMLCPQAKDTGYLTFDHYQYFGQICAAARLGCQLCHVLEQGVLHAQIDGLTVNNSIHSIEDARTYLLYRDNALANMNGNDDQKPHPRYAMRLFRETFLRDFACNLSTMWQGFSSFKFKRLLEVEETWEMEACFMLCASRGRCSYRDYLTILTAAWQMMLLSCRATSAEGRFFHPSTYR